jgi:hypothetical protein
MLPAACRRQCRDAARDNGTARPRRPGMSGAAKAIVQVLRHQPDGSWLRIIDRPEVPPA